MSKVDGDFEERHVIDFVTGGFFAIQRAGYFSLHGLFVGSFSGSIYSLSRYDYSAGVDIAVSFFVSAARVLAVLAGSWLFRFLSHTDENVLKSPRAASLFVLIIVPVMALVVGGISTATAVAAGV